MASAGALLVLFLAVSASSAPLPGSHADRAGPPPQEGDAFHSGFDAAAPVFAFVAEWGIAEASDSASQLPESLLRGQAEPREAPRTASLTLPLAGALIGALGLAIQGNPRTRG